jgi:tetratricopeptide (TPR) repeat protein
MRKILTISIAFFLFFSVSFGQEKTLKQQAIEEFKSEHYDEAISLLEDALKQSPNDAEIYYYLGFFNHYMANDSRLLSGYDYSYSQRIFEYLEKAIELNPNYGDAKYFYGAECCVNAFRAMQNYNLSKLKYYYKSAYDKGAYPAWLVEFGKNILNSCYNDAILFTGGNADFDVCTYLQLYENFRTDLTIIPIGNIDRPWYVQFLKNGLEGGVRKINFDLTNQQIMDIHPFKWDTTTISIPISENLRTEFNLKKDYELKWVVEPDLSSERMYSKIEGEKIKERTYLSPQRAILLQIVENNFSFRPIYFTNFVTPTMYGGLDAYFQDCGLVSRLVPVQTNGTDYALNTCALEKLLSKENFKDFASIKSNDIPRISKTTSSYYSAILNLGNFYRQRNELKKFDDLMNFYKSNMKIGFNLGYEEFILKEFTN